MYLLHCLKSLRLSAVKVLLVVNQVRAAVLGSRIVLTLSPLNIIPTTSESLCGSREKICPLSPNTQYLEMAQQIKSEN